VFSGKPSAINVACSVWEEGNEKGLKGTSSVPYFILRRADGKGPRERYLASRLSYLARPFLKMRREQRFSTVLFYNFLKVYASNFNFLQ